MTEHKAYVFRTPPNGRLVRVPETWPEGAEVTVTWTEPIKVLGTGPRWFTDNAWSDRGAVCFIDSEDRHWTVERDEWPWVNEDAQREASAALVDLIESDHLPPQMPNVDDIDNWLVRNGHAPFVARSHCRKVIRGTLDYFAALPAHARGPE